MLLFRSTIVLLSAVTSQAFLFNAFTAFPALKELAKSPTDLQLNIRLDIGLSNKLNHLFLDGLELELLQTAAAKGSILLPGADGPHPQTSSGKKGIHVSKMPAFIGMNGRDEVKLQNGAWEMIWKDKTPCGSLICGFEVKDKVTRNSFTAHVPAGRLFLTFPLWTQELLDQARENKARAFARRDGHAADRDRYLEEMHATDNIIKKAFLYRNAAEAFEKMDLTGWRMYNWIPDEEGVIDLGNGVLVGQLGSVWQKGEEFYSVKSNLGEATIRVDKPSEQTTFAKMHP